MARESFRRQAASRRVPDELRLPDVPRLPERLIRAFPEMRQYEDEMGVWQRKTAEQIRIALSETKEPGSDYVALFEEALS